MADIKRHGQAARVVRVDTSAENDVERLSDDATAMLGPVTGLVDDAGVAGVAGPLAELEAAALRRGARRQRRGVVLCARRAVRDMSPRPEGAAGRP
ncbi:NAD(P)-dependent dehydrogenase (short-subunit alcohol dehydrogenase family) [Actinoalloteichus hoggarensis]|uniref:SDR family NAD(P)-dependent oxidoreductase n=1 Tax=Actinoalloteichus hoggarensis TaxID=1470176 RepID=UPI0017E19078|nr:NAD(P)-dependent dehydrogenase (short-subunit alcohol dehydrogenase family) [Actinoalloteichus hoggarensis]